MLQIGVVAIFVALAALYAAPSVIAAVKGHRRWQLVVALNILFGWTIVAWLLALAVALELKPRRPVWAKRKPRARVKAMPQTSPQQETAARRGANDPPVIHEDVYADWLDKGAGLPASGTSETLSASSP